MIGLQRLTPGVQNILLLTTGFWVADLLLSRLGVMELGPLLRLQPAALLAGHSLWTPLTYLLAHQGFGHLFWNMLALWMFGSPVEEVLGERRLFQLYLVCGLAGAAAAVLSAYAGGHLVIETAAGPIPTTVAGSSGAVLGIVLAFALLFPDATVYLWFTVPVKARYLALLVIALAVLAPLADHDGSVSIPAHVGGLLGAWAVLHFKLWLQPPRARGAAAPALAPSGGPRVRVISRPPAEKQGRVSIAPEPSRSRCPSMPAELESERSIDQILDKIAGQGLESLSSEEKEQLDAHSARLRRLDRDR
ncbi:MAG: rhomboid family intramembrane serine protease [Armatimonadetes bacterium]|nr:rhomboid family intramembrane serine protease [Armatimonadota bacterium]